MLTTSDFEAGTKPAFCFYMSAGLPKQSSPYLHIPWKASWHQENSIRGVFNWFNVFSKLVPDNLWSECTFQVYFSIFMLNWLKSEGYENQNDSSKIFLQPTQGIGGLDCCVLCGLFYSTVFCRNLICGKKEKELDARKELLWAGPYFWIPPFAGGSCCCSLLHFSILLSLALPFNSY